MTLRDAIGREPITIVEIDQDFCALTYGVSPCAAALGVTGSTKCYNTIVSCQDTDNFDLGSLTLRFCTPVEDTGLPKTLMVIPSLKSVTTVPTRINIGGADPQASPLGQRAKITAEFRDHPYHDRLVDPYWSERGFDPATRGTFWSKWLARNPYHQGRALRVREGYVGQPLAEMRVRHYVIERIDGPTRGVVKIIAKDPLKLLDDARAKAPVANSGVLLADISDVSGGATLTPAGVGNAEYAGAGIARIGSELVSFSRVGDGLFFTGRGLRGSVASSHAEGDAFQQVLVITSQRVDLLLANLMTTYSGIDAAFIPTADWDAEADLWCNGFNLSAWITEPTGVGQLVGEIIDQTGVFIWWDDEDKEIQFRATRPFYPLFDAVAIEVGQDANIVADSFELEFRPDERITQVWIYYGQENPAESANDPANFVRRRILVDEDSESALRYNDQRIRTIFARFLDEANDAATSVVASRILERARETPRIVKFAADAKDSDIRAGSVIRLSHRELVDLTGAPAATLLQVTAAEAVDPGHMIAFEARPNLSRVRYCFIVANGSPDYSAASETQRASGGWIAPSVLGFANGDLPYRIL